MDNKSSAQNGEPESNDRTGLVVLLIFVLGLPLLGILAKMLGF
jgi:hypothetical protein